MLCVRRTGVRWCVRPSDPELFLPDGSVARPRRDSFPCRPTVPEVCREPDEPLHRDPLHDDPHRYGAGQRERPRRPVRVRHGRTTGDGSTPWRDPELPLLRGQPVPTPARPRLPVAATARRDAVDPGRLVATESSGQTGVQPELRGARGLAVHASESAPHARGIGPRHDVTP